ncbi:MAG: gfo/Idh/MocA family oxidoreductase [Frankiales bacterium]|jgi:predicted dehydrogenase|nr:gfo/Idh/MocA family oxidoreductase [Frankiales bacterium]
MAAHLPEDRPIRWGLLGAGGIARNVSEDISRTEGNVVGAVAARDGERAAEFAAQFPGATSYGSYAELVADPEVDVVYVATTHPSHHEQALMAIAAGKPVLVEKPVCLNARQTHEVLAAARHADVFAMEAMWMRTNPLIRQAEQLVADGAIGDLLGLRAEFGLGLPFDPSHRLYDMSNGGGSLLDLGIYVVTFGYLFLGRPDQVRTTGTLSPTGSEDRVAMQWDYANGTGARLWCSASVSAPNQAVLLGSNGWIATEGAFHRPSGLVISQGDPSRGGGRQHVPDPIAGRGHGYGPEIAEVARCLRAGLIESPLVPHADTIAVMALLDEARADLGVKYPGE